MKNETGPVIPMLDSQSNVVKASMTSNAFPHETQEREQQAEFEFSVTWVSVFPASAAAKRGDLVPRPRVPTLVASSKSTWPAEDWRNFLAPAAEAERILTASNAPRPPHAPAVEETSIAKPGWEQLPSFARPEAESKPKVSWEMVVPKMVRSEPKFKAALPDAQETPASPETRKSTPVRNPLWYSLPIIAGTIFISLLLHRWMPASKPTAPALTAAPLKLNAEVQPNGLVDIKWNAGSAVVTRAQQGRLIINEQDQQPRILPLGREQLKSGHLQFQPLGSRVGYQLEVTDDSGTTTKESVLTQSSSVPVAPPAREPVAVASGSGPTAKIPSANKVKAASTDEEKTEPSQITRSLVPQKSPEPAASVPPPSAPAPPPQSSPSAAQTTVADQTSVVSKQPELPLTRASAELPTRVPEPAPQTTIPAAKAAPQAAPVVVGGNVQMAKLIKKVLPAYPLGARSASVEGTVEFTAMIAKDGTIRSLKLLKGPPLLVKAAQEAVQKWVYQPTLLNGQPVEVVTQIDVNFKLQR